jgi:hypothetical protein
VLYKYEGWGKGHTYAHTPPCETLAVMSSQLNSEALVAHVVLAHTCTTFHPCTCELHGGAAEVAAALIGYDDVEVAAWMTTVGVSSAAPQAHGIVNVELHWEYSPSIFIFSQGRKDLYHV